MSSGTSFLTLSPTIRSAVFGKESLIFSGLSADGREISAFFVQCLRQLALVGKKRLPSLCGDRAVADLARRMQYPEIPTPLQSCASAVIEVNRGVKQLQSKLCELSAEERGAVLRLVPQCFQDRLREARTERESYQQSRALGYALLSAEVISGASCVMRRFQQDCAGVACDIAQPLVERMVTAETRRTVIDGLSAVGREFWESLVGFGESVLTLLAPHVTRLIQTQLGELITGLTSDFRIVEEVLTHMDALASRLPPAKLANVVFTSLAEHCSLRQLAKKERAEEGSVDDPALLLALQLRRAALRGSLPTREMNRGFSLLFQYGYHPTCMRRQAILCFRNAIKHRGISAGQNALLRDQFRAFCVASRIDASADFELLEAAFYCKNQPVEAEIAFLAHLILLNPARSRTIFQIEDLVHAAGFLYIKHELYPRIVQHCLPADFSHFISGCSKLLGVDLNDIFSSGLANLFLQQGLNLLHDEHLLSTTVLKFFDPRLNFEEYTVGSGAPEEVSTRFMEFCTHLGTPAHPAALKRLALERAPGRAKADLTHSASVELQNQFRRLAGGLPAVKRFIAGSTVTSVGADMVQLPRRRDWGLWILLFAGNLHRVLEHPGSVPPLNLLSAVGKEGVQVIIEDLLPSLSWIPGLTSLLNGHLEVAQRRIGAVEYAECTRGVQLNLKIKMLTAYVMKCLKYHADQPFPAVDNEALLKQGLERAMHQHVRSAVEAIWGVKPNTPEAALYQERYIDFLLRQDQARLLNMIQSAGLRPREMQQVVLRDREEALNENFKQLEAWLQALPNLAVQKRVEVEVIDRELSQIAGQLGKYDELVMVLGKLEAAIRKDPKRNEFSGLGEATLNSKLQAVTAQLQCIAVRDLGDRRLYLNARRKALLKVNETPPFYSALDGMTKELELLYAAQARYRDAADVQVLQKEIESLEHALKKLIERLKLATTGRSSTTRSQEVQALEEEYASIRIRLESKKKVLHELSTQLDKQFDALDHRIELQYKRMAADPRWGELRALKWRLCEVRAAEGPEHERVFLEQRIHEMQQRLKFEQLALQQEDASCNRSYGRVPFLLRRKMHLYQLVRERAMLEERPGPTKATELARLNREIGGIYTQIIQFEHGHVAALSLPALEKEHQQVQRLQVDLKKRRAEKLLKLGSEVSASSAAVAHLRTALEECHKQRAQLLADESVNQELASDIEAFARRPHLRSALKANRRDLQSAEKQLADLDNKMELYLQERDAGRTQVVKFLKASQRLIYGDPVLENLQKEALTLKNTIARLKIQIDHDQKLLSKALPALRRLKAFFKTDDLAAIKLQYADRCAHIQDQQVRVKAEIVRFEHQKKRIEMELVVPQKIAYRKLQARDEQDEQFFRQELGELTARIAQARFLL